MRAPYETIESTSSSVGGKVEIEARGSVGVPLVAQGKVGATTSGEVGREKTNSIKVQRGGLEQVVKDIAKSDYVLLIDDFHYMDRSVQESAAKVLKEAAFRGVKVCVASVPHRADDVVRANPELRGRVLAVDLGYWSLPHLRQIARLGFELLNVRLDDKLAARFAEEAAGSPQLMQAICLNTCFQLDVKETLDAMQPLAVDEHVNNIFERTASSTDFRSLVDAMDEGPRTRGTERKLYKFNDGTKGDVYRCVLKVLAATPPQLSFDYDDLTTRVKILCRGDAPVGSSIVSTCDQINKRGALFSKERAIEWDAEKQVVSIADPHLLFYLRWSTHLDVSDE